MKRIIAYGVIGSLCLAATYFAMTSRPRNSLASINTPPVEGMPVSVLMTSPGEYPSQITALGEVTPRYQSTIKAQVAGQISFLSGTLQEGTTVHAGEVLVGIERSGFVLQVNEAESRLKTAHLDLLKEEREARNAKKNWLRSGIKESPSSRLVLRKPYLEAARASLNAAISALENARVQLSHTEIRAPYEGVIMKRSVNPAETVFAGTEVATLYSLQAVEVGIQLDTSEWNRLPRPIETAPVRLIDPRQQKSWNAHVLRKSMHLDRETRLRTLYVEVKEPLTLNPQLLPGTFVRVIISGKKISNLLCIPEAAHTKEGLVWTVDDNNRLAAYISEPLFYGKGVVYIKNPLPATRTLQVAASPNASFTNGLRVRPIQQ